MSDKAIAVLGQEGVRSEPDLVLHTQENLKYQFSTPPSSPLNHKKCFSMLEGTPSPHLSLPMECEKFSDIRDALERQNSKKSNMSIAFEGMHAGEAAAAMAARERGQLHHAQVQRRLTSDKNNKLW